MVYICIMINKKYYFITYQGERRDSGEPNIWNQVINTSPMAFIKDVLKCELESENGGYYRDFIVINTCEISKEDFTKYQHEF